MSQRTELQREADKLDCDLYRVISGVEYLIERNPRIAAELRHATSSLRKARAPLRTLMHPIDRERTRGY